MFRQLRVLDYFDFWMKLEDDVRWAKPFPGDFHRHLVTKHSIFFHSGALKPSKYPRCRDQGYFAL